jgi:hypothetical protein
MKKDIRAIILLSFYLLCYAVLLNFEVTYKIAFIMWMLSPLLIISTVIYVLKFGIYNGPELGEKEFGYTDKKD